MKRISGFFDAARKSLRLCLFCTAGLHVSAQAEESGFALTLSRAVELHEAGGIDAALQIYRSLREDQPLEPRLLYEFARSLRATGDLDGCVEQAALGAAISSDWQARAAGLLARCEREGGATLRALLSYRAALERFPADARLHFDYAMMLEERGETAIAATELSAAFALAGQDPTLYLDYAAWLSARRDTAGALLMNLRYIMAAPHSSQAVGVAEQVQSLLLGRESAATVESAPSSFSAAYQTALALESGETERSAADQLSLILQRFVLESVSSANPPRDSVLWAAAIEPLVSLAEHDVLDAYLYFVAALARTEGSPEWLSVHRDKFERLVEYLARSGRSS